MRDTMREMFDSLLVDEPPLRTSAPQVRQQGRRRLHRRRVAIAAGSALTVGVAASATMVYRSPDGQLLVAPLTSETPSAHVASPSAMPWPTVTPTQLFERETCDGDGTPKLLADTDGSVLPDPSLAVSAVLDAVASIAPGRTFRLVTAGRQDLSAKHPDAARVYLIFDVSDRYGTGSVNLEVFPQAGLSAAERAGIDLRARPYAHCAPPIRTDFQDGAVGLEYTAFGTGEPESSVQHISYYSPDGFDVNAGMFLDAWDEPKGQPRTSMPLTSGEVLEICRLVALS